MMAATVTPIRGRASVAVRQRDELREEVSALRAEARDLAEEVIPLSRYLWNRATINGEPVSKDVADRIVHLLERSNRRNGGDDAA